MSIKKVINGTSFDSDSKFFLIEVDSDLQLLEQNYSCQQGDVAELPTGAQYIRQSNGNWVLQPIGDSGGGGGSPSGTITITRNGLASVAGYSQANVNVTPNLQSKNVTPSDTTQTITADNNYDGLNIVTVSGDQNLIAGNIRKDYSIFGVTGSFEGEKIYPVLQEKTVLIRENKTTVLTPDSGYDGLSKATINTEVYTNALDNDVIFIDYDGEILYSYTVEEFLELSALPENPSHEGLIAQGWNWSLVNAKNYVQDNGGLIIGQNYITDDNKTRIYIELDEGRLSPTLNLSGNAIIEIDWGDGSSITTASNDVTVQHTYQSAGKYMISINRTQGYFYLGYSSSQTVNSHSNLLTRENDEYNEARFPYSYYQKIKKIELGSHFRLLNSAFQQCTSLETITITKENLSQYGIPSYCFNGCKNLKAVVIPGGYIDAAGIIGKGAFQNCGAEKISIPYEIGTVQQDCFKESQIYKVAVPTQVKTIPDYCFQNSNIQQIYLPNTVETFNDCAFYGCYLLNKIRIPNSLTSIGQYCFYKCDNLTKIILPSNLATIKLQGIYLMSGLKEVHFLGNIPPVFVNSNSFSNNGWITNNTSDTIIYIPSGSLSEYNVTNSPTITGVYTIVEE